MTQKKGLENDNVISPSIFTIEVYFHKKKRNIQTSEKISDNNHIKLLILN